MARKVFIAGNWKMNKTAAETVELCKALKEKFADVCPCKADVAVCPPFTSIAAAIEELKGSNIKVGAQNIHWADNGAFTGEISGAMPVSNMLSSATANAVSISGKPMKR